MGPRLNEGELGLLASCSIDGDEGVQQAIVRAFSAANVDVSERDATLEEWIDTDALRGFDWSADRPLFVSAPMWGHQVVVTPERVRVYSDARVE